MILKKKKNLGGKGGRPPGPSLDSLVDEHKKIGLDKMPSLDKLVVTMTPFLRRQDI